MKKMRLLILSPVAERGGAERVMVDILKHLNADRFEAEVVFFQQGRLVQEVEQLGCRTHVLAAARLRNVTSYVRVINQLRGLIRSRGIDLVVNWMPKAHLYGGVAARLERKPAVWWQHGVPDKHWLDRLVSRIPATGVLCPSLISKHYQEKLKPRAPVLLNNLGVDLEEFPVAPPEGSDFRARHGIPQEAIVFAFLGRLQRWKRPDVVIRAFNRVSRMHPVYMLVIGGALFGLETEYEDELRAIAREAGHPERILFLGHQQQVAPILAATDVVVHASLLEPFGMVITESMALGKTVLAVGRGGPKEIINSGFDGLLYDGTEDQLVELMTSIIEGKVSVQTLGKNARSTIESRFTAHKMAERFENNLNQLLVQAKA
ncbi:Glycosyltransferase involved in cell wall bisynthesis [Paenibacillus sp. UNCCL117]|uniref:glycosyltransferase family 4 protein n=1 Tax=unclassified Paenibacillus TaxID=185978 RepID=UPI000887FB8F|nr:MULTISPECIES: glycosyltransferase family 4 protein [unclassified Paenibacillus]SDC02410.1 Glycosyltransferase involved in cell wall bisynthesis [Paenibacillus sp. cl123]SFW36844.1 Glycosyltransferase involved in cell wall bisynthesis [Paenibacillus sp. UNCCL117]